MTSKKIYYLLLSCLGLIGLLAIGGLVLGNRLLAQSAETLNAYKLETSVLYEQQSSLNLAKQDIEKYTELDAIASAIVPKEKDQARTVREIIDIAANTNVPVTSINFPASDLGEAPPKPAAPTPAPTDGSTAPASRPAPPKAPSQLTAVKDIPGVYQLDITVANDSNNLARYQDFVEFLRQLQQNRRTALVTSIGIQPDTDNRNLLVYSLTLSVYIKP